jgi:hypothetical protein
MSETCKTLVIWSDFQELPQAFLLNGNLSHLNGVIINDSGNKALEAELNSLMYNDEGYLKHEPVDVWAQPLSQTVGPFADYCIRCGFAL